VFVICGASRGPARRERSGSGPRAGGGRRQSAPAARSSSRRVHRLHRRRPARPRLDAAVLLAHVLAPPAMRLSRDRELTIGGPQKPTPCVPSGRRSVAARSEREPASPTSSDAEAFSHLELAVDRRALCPAGDRAVVAAGRRGNTERACSTRHGKRRRGAAIKQERPICWARAAPAISMRRRSSGARQLRALG